MRTPQRARFAQATVMLAAGLAAVPALMGASHPQSPPGTPATASASATAKVPSTASASATARVTATASAAGTRKARVPGLTVTVSDGHIAARPGQVLTYLVTVRDTGSVAAPHLQGHPNHVRRAEGPFRQRSRRGGGRAGVLAGLAAGGSRTFRVVARVTRTPAALLRLAAVACVTLPGSSRPVVCAAHLDRLPAAAAVAPSGHSGLSAAAYAAIGLAAAVLCLLAVIVRRRGRLRGQRALPGQ